MLPAADRGKRSLTAQHPALSKPLKPSDPPDTSASMGRSDAHIPRKETSGSLLVESTEGRSQPPRPLSRQQGAVTHSSVLCAQQSRGHLGHRTDAQLETAHGGSDFLSGDTTAVHVSDEGGKDHCAASNTAYNSITPVQGWDWLATGLQRIQSLDAAREGGL